MYFVIHYLFLNSLITNYILVTKEVQLSFFTVLSREHNNNYSSAGPVDRKYLSRRDSMYKAILMNVQTV